jgi:hypothetical protein
MGARPGDPSFHAVAVADLGGRRLVVSCAFGSAERRLRIDSVVTSVRVFSFFASSSPAAIISQIERRVLRAHRDRYGLGAQQLKE